MTSTMTINNAPAFEENIFFSLAYASELARLLRLGHAYLRCYKTEWQLNSRLETLIDSIKTFSPQHERAREMLDALHQLHRRIEENAAKRGSLPDPAFLKHWNRAIKRQNKIIGSIAESWELALNPNFNKLVNEGINGLHSSGKSNSNWRSWLAEMRDSAGR